LDYVFVGVMMMKEKIVEDNVVEKTRGKAWMQGMKMKSRLQERCWYKE
jgi:hypothetical protein